MSNASDKRPSSSANLTLVGATPAERSEAAPPAPVAGGD